MVDNEMIVKLYYCNREVSSAEVKSKNGFRLYYGDSLPSVTTPPGVLAHVCLNVFELFYSIDGILRFRHTVLVYLRLKGNASRKRDVFLCHV